MPWLWNFRIWGNAHAATFNDIKSRAITLLNDLESNESDTEQQGKTFEHSYQQAKQALLRAGAKGHLRARTLTGVMEQLSSLHSMVRHAIKAHQYLSTFIARSRDGLSEVSKGTL